MTASPSRNPAKAALRLRPLRRAVASASPVSVMPSVNQFGTRRLLKSIAAPRAPLPATTATTTRSEVAGNGRPQHGSNRFAERRDGREGGDRDQRGQQTVLGQVLRVVSNNQPVNHRNHGL